MLPFAASLYLGFLYTFFFCNLVWWGSLTFGVFVALGGWGYDMVGTRSFGYDIFLGTDKAPMGAVSLRKYLHNIFFFVN